MPKCPKCNNEIDHLRCFTKVWREDEFTLEIGQPRYEADQICMSDPVETEFVCPECDLVLCNTEAEAIAILKV